MLIGVRGTRMWVYVSLHFGGLSPLALDGFYFYFFMADSSLGVRGGASNAAQVRSM